MPTISGVESTSTIKGFPSMSKRILVVDDDAMIRTLVSDYLSMFGNQVEQFERGSECLTRLKDEIPNLIILDMQMPEMTGAEVINALKQDPLTSKIPVILLSANAESAHAILSEYNVQADKYILKPFDMKMLLQSVNEIAS